ncbi:hypothetical protein J6590_025714 [Homalodisca vitripennis]|nr:hypothetical protein J6590_025714 [Homalodisca vitripennis]
MKHGGYSPLETGVCNENRTKWKSPGCLAHCCHGIVGQVPSRSSCRLGQQPLESNRHQHVPAFLPTVTVLPPPLHTLGCKGIKEGD